MVMKKTGQPKPADIDLGMLVVVEGMDGAGKSTLVPALGEKLEEQGVEVVLTREPTRDLQFGQIICSNRESRFSPLEEYWLFMLDRAQHAREVIYPALEQGKVIITDRYYHSTMVYQAPRMTDGGVYGMRQRIWREALTICPLPDLLLIMDLPPEVAYERIQSGRKADAFETPEQLQQYREAYRAFADNTTFGEGATVLDATQSQDDLVLQAVEKILVTRAQLERTRTHGSS